VAAEEKRANTGKNDMVAKVRAEGKKKTS